VAQHDYIIANQSGAAFRADLNNGLAAIVSQNSGAAQPSTTYAYQWWADTTTGLLKIRNAANSAWITVGTLADANLGLLPAAGGTLTGNLTLNAQSDLRLADTDSSNWVALHAPTTVASNITLTVPSTVGSADQALVTDGTGVLSFASRSRLVRATAVATTSGTSNDFTSIPSWVRRITVVLDGVSTSGLSRIQIQLGDSGGIETSGYSGGNAAITLTPAADPSYAAYSSGFVLPAVLTAAQGLYGLLTIVNISGNTWVASGTFDNNASVAGMTQGAKALSATFDRLRITTVNGTDTFDAGTANIIYED
jgi:hypothetical protein